jgi:hypothetical protein
MPPCSPNPEATGLLLHCVARCITTNHADASARSLMDSPHSSQSPYHPLTTSLFSGDGVASRGPSYGMPAVRVDGGDALAVYNATRAARELALEHSCPVGPPAW